MNANSILKLAGGLCMSVLWTGVLALAVPKATGAEVTVEKIPFSGWEKCYRMTNGEVELVAVAEVGPRILHFGFRNGDNILYIDETGKGKTGGDEWIPYGGHRLWIAPEHVDTTYYPDNVEVDAKVNGNQLILTSIPEIHDEALRAEVKTLDDIESRLEDPEIRQKVGLQKIVILTMSQDGDVVVEHKVVNRGYESIDMAPWALTVMGAGGVTIVPNAPYAPHGPDHFLPVRSLVLWSYTDLQDARLKFMDRYTTLRQDPEAESPIKFGFSDTGGWAAYARNETLFVKHLNYDPRQTYPDMGCSVEFFTNNEIMEIESVGPAVTLAPGGATSHFEKWRLHKIEPAEQTEADVSRVVQSAGLE